MATKDPINLDEAEPTVTVQTGVCSVCGEPAWTARATKCDKHRSIRSKRTATKASDDVPITVEKPAPNTTPTVDDDKANRVKMLKHSITHDLNPVLVQGFAMACRPVPADNFYTLKGEKIEPTQLGAEVQLDGWTVEILARAAAELENSPILQSAKVIAGPMLPIAYGIGAAVVLALHINKTMTLRAGVLQQWTAQMQAQQAQAQQAQQATQDPFNTGATFTSDVDSESQVA